MAPFLTNQLARTRDGWDSAGFSFPEVSAKSGGGWLCAATADTQEEGDEWAERQVVMDESETSPLIGQLQAGLGLSRFWM